MRPPLERQPVTTGWQMAAAESGAPRPDEGWIPAAVPGTVAGALAAAGAPVERLDERDWWFVARLPPTADDGAEVSLRLGGIATLAEIRIDGEIAGRSDSMFATQELPLAGGEQELAICCRALGPHLAERRRPRARWRTRLVEPGNLRFVRTMLLGRAPGFAPGPAVVGPWRPVELVRRRVAVAEATRLRAHCDGADGVVRLTATVRGIGGARVDGVRLVVSRGQERWEQEVAVGEGGRLADQLRIERCTRWWPHTHGEPALYDVALELRAGDELVRQPLGRIGFRSLRAAERLAERGLDLQLNDVPVFVRGAVWTPLGLTTPYADRASLLPVLEQVVDAGLNMLRVPGTALYESDDFLDACDELGILLWQDFMFANLDYPESEPSFMAAVTREVEAELDRLGPRPCLTALCGGSEVAQQVAMLGLDPALAEGPLYAELLPRLVAEADLAAPYIPSSPWGGDLPFRAGTGIANYYGVGAYRRPLSDARLSEVKFAGECLAFANLPDDDALPGAEEPLGVEWKRGVPRDRGAGWDFDDVRDHYLRALRGVDPVSLRYSDPRGYRELSRAISGEVMAATFGEWRREASPCTGALVLWLTDLVPGAGWGLLDHRGRPKVALHHLRRVLAPVAVWPSDEGLNGIVAHVANDRPSRLEATLRATTFRDFEHPVEAAERAISLAGHTTTAHNVEELLGRFVDASWAYRFGNPVHDLIVLTLHAGDEIISETFVLPAGPPAAEADPARLGLQGAVHGLDGPEPELVLSTRRFAHGVRVHLPGYAPADDALSLAPGTTRRVALRPLDPAAAGRGTLTALNLTGAVPITRAELN